MSNFDYFDEEAIAAGGRVDELRDELPDALRERLDAWHRRRRRAVRAALTLVLFLAAVTWLLWGHRDRVGYVFSSPQEPSKLGDASTFTPSDIPHNAYVELRGITEHRGMSQKLVRGLGLIRNEYWYFRLLGSRGVFIEVPADASHYGPATALIVSGRAVDPSREQSTYGPLLASYSERFSAPLRPGVRIIQVGVRPGEGRLPYLAAFAGLLVVGIANIVLVGFLLRSLGRGPERDVLGSA